jgi:uncharacterized protein YjbI with pentapeptide repeats
MTTQLKEMKGEEFVRKILDGERDFSGIKLEEGFDLSGYEGFEELQRYLKSQPLEKEPIIIHGSILRYVKARNLYLPYVRGNKVSLYGADLGEAILWGADLRGADLRGVINLGQAFNLPYAIFGETIVTTREKEIIEKEFKKLFVIE